MDIKKIIEKINPKNNKAVFLAAAIFVFIIILTTVLVNISAGRKKDYAPVVYEKPDSKKDFIFQFKPDSDDLKIPPDYLKNPAFTWRPFRITPDKWEKEEIDRFWKDPADVIIEVYSDENKKAIQNILEDVP